MPRLVEALTVSLKFSHVVLTVLGVVALHGVAHRKVLHWAIDAT